MSETTAVMRADGPMIREALEFLTALFGSASAGYLNLWTKQGKQSHWRSVDQIEDAAGLAETLACGSDVYVGCCLHRADLGPKERGKAADTLAMPALYVELDFLDPAHKASDLAPTVGDLMTLVRAYPHAPSVVVHSGHGLQCWWVFKEPWVFDRTDERAAAHTLNRRLQRWFKVAARERGWAVDSTADLARVLRVPGTMNRKNEWQHLPVRMLHHDATVRYSPDDFDWLPTVEAESLPLDRPGGSGDGAPSDLGKILSGCAWLRHCRDDARTLSEPAWFAMLSIVGRCEGGEAAAQAFSKPYPAYSQEETAAKLQHALTGAGPRTCAYIRGELDGEEFCRGCPSLGKVKSPIVIGTPRAEEAPPHDDRDAPPAARGVSLNGKHPALPPVDAEPAADEDIFADLNARLYNGPQLMALQIEEPQWLAKGLVSRGNLTLLGGMGKLGKSVLAHQLCGAAAAGGIWLDQQLPVMNALYVNWEDPLNLTRARALQQCAGQELPETYHVLDVPWDTSLNRFLAWLYQILTDRKIELVVIDPLATAAHWEDEDDNDTTRDTMRSIQEVAARTGAAIFIVHHIRKSGGEFGMELRGAGAIFNGLQGYLGFRRQGEGKYRLDVLTKMPGEHGGDKSLILEREPHTLTWHVASEVSQQAVDRQETEARIVDLIQGNPGSTRAELAGASGIAESTLRRYLDALIEKGAVYEVVRPRREGDERGGRSAMGLFLKPDAGF